MRYSTNMNKFQIWLLKKIFRKAFAQGPYHQLNLKTVYMLISDTWKTEFLEDNSATCKDMLQETFDSANSKVL